MPKSISIRLPDDLAERIEASANKNGRSLNKEILFRLEAGAAPANGFYLSVRLPKATVVKSVKDYIEKKQGMMPELEADLDIEQWTRYTITKLTKDTESPVSARVQDEFVIVGGNEEVIEAIRSHFTVEGQ